MLGTAKLLAPTCTGSRNHRNEIILLGYSCDSCRSKSRNENKTKLRRISTWTQSDLSKYACPKNAVAAQRRTTSRKPSREPWHRSNPLSIQQGMRFKTKFKSHPSPTPGPPRCRPPPNHPARQHHVSTTTAAGRRPSHPHPPPRPRPATPMPRATPALPALRAPRLTAPPPRRKHDPAGCGGPAAAL
jgi:hypothetical protein